MAALAKVRLRKPPDRDTTDRGKARFPALARVKMKRRGLQSPRRFHGFQTRKRKQPRPFRGAAALTIKKLGRLFSGVSVALVHHIFVDHLGDD